MKITDKEGFDHEISIGKKCTIEIFKSHLANCFPKSTFDIKEVFIKLGGKIKDGSSSGAVQQSEKPESTGNRKNSNKEK